MSAVISEQKWAFLEKTLVWLAVQGASHAGTVRFLPKVKLLFLPLTCSPVLPGSGQRDLPVPGNPKRQSPIMSELESALEMDLTFIQCVFREHLLSGSALTSDTGPQGNKE